MKVSEKISHDFKTLDNGLRQRILLHVKKNPGKSVKEIYKELNIEQSVCSNMLRMCRDSNFVSTKRDGKKVHYYINPKGFDDVANFVSNFREEK